MTGRRTKDKKPRDRWVFVEWLLANDFSGYHGACYKESDLPALFASLKAKGVVKVTLDEKEERKL